MAKKKSGSLPTGPLGKFKIPAFLYLIERILSSNFERIQ